MAKYRVEFDSRYNDPEVTDGQFHRDYLDNNGFGFTYDEAVQVKHDLALSSVATNKNFNIVKVIPQAWGTAQVVQ